MSHEPFHSTFRHVIPKSVLKRYMQYIWHDITGSDVKLRVQKKAFRALHILVQQQLLECLRAAKRCCTLAKRQVVMHRDVYFVRCTLFSNICFHSTVPGRKAISKPLANNACKALGKLAHVSLSKKKNTNPKRPWSVFDELRHLLGDMVFEILYHVLRRGEFVNMLCDTHVDAAVHQIGLKASYSF